VGAATQARRGASVEKERSDDTIEIEAEPLELTPEEEAELAESLAEADRGDFVTAEELLERLRR
jgi:predicted transcriptional regulator